MRTLSAFLAITVICTGIYMVPSLAESALVHWRLNPWISCVALGDLAGCGILFVLGFRKMAVATYFVSSALEAGLLAARILPAGQLVWVANLIPALVLGFILVQAALRNLVEEEIHHAEIQH